MVSKRKNGNQTCGWASAEFGEVDLGDQRLRTRLIKLADRFVASPESPVNQVCNDWTETKAAYRFFS
ncbi:transposase [Elusimicrobiota bacterium]